MGEEDARSLPATESLVTRAWVHSNMWKSAIFATSKVLLKLMTILMISQAVLSKQDWFMFGQAFEWCMKKYLFS